MRYRDTMKITILTLFPHYFTSILETSMIKRAQAAGLVEFSIINIRDHAMDKHKLTDDRPFGGGPGMVMLVEPIDRALHSIQAEADSDTKKIILTSAKGVEFTQEVAQAYAQLDELILICGHYEGVDERVAQNLVDAEVRVGDYVLTGGEPAVAVILDTVTRLLPGVLGNEESNIDESHSKPGKLGYPAYSRPAEYKGLKVPEVLLSGDHQKIADWRKSQIKS